MHTILEIYDAAEVKRLKTELVAAGVKDTQYLIQNRKAITALDNVGFKLMKDNNLLNDDGKIVIIDGLYRPEEFAQSVLKYCKRKYASLGEQKGFYLRTMQTTIPTIDSRKLLLSPVKVMTANNPVLMVMNRPLELFRFSVLLLACSTQVFHCSMTAAL